MKGSYHIGNILNYQQLLCRALIISAFSIEIVLQVAKYIQQIYKELGAFQTGLATTWTWKFKSESLLSGAILPSASIGHVPTYLYLCFLACWYMHACIHNYFYLFYLAAPDETDAFFQKFFEDEVNIIAIVSGAGCLILIIIIIILVCIICTKYAGG